MQISLTSRDRAAHSTGERVYATLRAAIASAELAPGRRLSESELASELGVSRTPIREALSTLREERLIAIVPQLGTFVTLISPRAVEDAAFVRETLECASVRMACERATEDELEDLQANLAAQERALAREDTARFDRLDFELHRLLGMASGHPVAWVLAQRANGQLDRVRHLSFPEPGYLASMLEEHRLIVGAVGERDADAAESAMRHHVRMVPSLLPALRATHPEYFDDEAPR